MLGKMHIRIFLKFNFVCLWFLGKVRKVRFPGLVASPPLFIIPIRPFRDTLKFRKREEEPQANYAEPNLAPRRGENSARPPTKE